ARLDEPGSASRSVSRARGVSADAGGRDRHALVLAGGGARGAYGVGVAKALLTAGTRATGGGAIDPAVFSGTSVGAYNAAVLASHADEKAPKADAEYLEHVWVDEIPRTDVNGSNRVYRFRGDPFQLLDPSYVYSDPLGPGRNLLQDTVFLTTNAFRRGVNFLRSPNVLGSPGIIPHRTLELLDVSPVVSVEPLADLIGETIDFGRIRRGRRAVRIAPTEWRSGQVKVFKNDDMVDDVGRAAVLASASVPGVFPPVAIGDTPYVDGGVMMNTPLMPAIEAGADTLHVVYMD